MPARHASRRRQPQPASNHGCHSQNFLRGDSLQFQVAANAASRIEQMPKRYRSRVEPRFASCAAPRKDTNSTEQIFRNGPPPRSPAGHAFTRWAVHRLFLEGPLRKRIGESPRFGNRLSPLSHLTKYNRNRHGRLHYRPRPRGHRNEITEA
jgi:hypothetical protein